jgi:CTD small phosphatase-like protein 2
VIEEQRDLKNVIIVDNSVFSFMLHLTNWIPVTDFTGDKKDMTFIMLTHYLKSLLHVNDIRSKIEEDFGVKEVIESHSKNLYEY